MSMEGPTPVRTVYAQSPQVIHGGSIGYANVHEVVKVPMSAVQVVQAAPPTTVYAQPTRIVEQAQHVIMRDDHLEPHVATLQMQVATLQKQVTEAAQHRERLETTLHTTRYELQQEVQNRCNTDNELNELRNKVLALEAHISEFDFFSRNELQRQVHRIEARGNVQVNFETGIVVLLQPINFQPRTTRDSPTAEFSRPETAFAVCQDVAEVARIFDCSLDIEGHTKGGEGEFWQTLADERARVVLEKLVDFGVSRDKMSSRGLPGRIGLNETRTVLRLNLPTDGTGTGSENVQAMRRLSNAGVNAMR